MRILIPSRVPTAYKTKASKALLICSIVVWSTDEFGGLIGLLLFDFFSRKAIKVLLIHTKYILQPLFDVRNATPPRVLKLGP